MNTKYIKYDQFLGNSIADATEIPSLCPHGLHSFCFDLFMISSSLYLDERQYVNKTYLHDTLSYSFFSMVDLLTVIPIWITSSTHCPQIDDVINMHSLVIYIICGLSTTRILRFLRIHRLIRAVEDQVKRCLMQMLLVVTAIILFNSAVVQYLETNEQPLPFHTWMYFTWITVATIGYGDISAKSVLGQDH